MENNIMKTKLGKSVKISINSSGLRLVRDSVRSSVIGFVKPTSLDSVVGSLKGSTYRLVWGAVINSILWKTEIWKKN